MRSVKVLMAATCIGLLADALCAPATAKIGLPFHVPLLSGPAPAGRQALAQGDWKLRVETASFSGEKRCHLEDRRHLITYAGGALGFRFDPSLNTLGAWLRIDDGPAIRWRDYLPELTRLGVPMAATRIDSPTDGIVWVPAAALEAASHIAIQPAERKRPVTFPLQGFTPLRDAARQMGCVPEQRFVR